MFSLKIVTVDHYQANPIPGIDVLYSDFRGSEINNVPVIRIFGVTAKGQKACLHVHGVFPYISIPFDGGGDENPECFMQQLCLSIDKALNIASGKNNAHMHHVYKISLITGIPFYGYHEKQQKFFRIFFYNPEIIKKVVELLQVGAVINQVMQPYEAHIPYILQFFIDYNLYGMSTIDVSKIKFRLPLNASPAHGSMTDWKMNNLPSDMILDASVERLTYCEVEGDCSSEDILNRKMSENFDMNPGLKFIWEDERQRQKIRCETGQFTPLPSQKGDCMELTESEHFYKNRLRTIIERIPVLKNKVEEISIPEDTCRADRGLINCTPAGIVEIHRTFSQGKEVSEPSKSIMKTKSLTQEELTDKPLTQSQNASTYEDKEFLEMIISMIDNQNYSAPTDTESIIINQQSEKSAEETNYNDIEDELEMSLCIWDEDICTSSEVVSLQDAEATCLDIHSEYKASNNEESNIYNEEENKDRCYLHNSNAKNVLIDDFTIPQIDGMHDAASQSNTTTENMDCSRRELPIISTLSDAYTAASEAPWMQATYTSSICDQYSFCYGAYTPYNQPIYCLASSNQYNSYNDIANQSSSTSFSENSLNNGNNNNEEWLHSPSNSSSLVSLQSGMDICTPSYSLLSNISTSSSSTNTVINERTDCYNDITKHTHLTPTNSVFTGQIISTGIKDHSLYKAGDTGRFTTIDTKVLKEDSPKVMTSHKNSDCSTKLLTNLPFNVVKKIEINNIGTQIYPCRVGELLSMKTKIKSVCNTSTQTNITDSKSSFHQEEKIKQQRKSNPRTLVVQHMRRLKLSLSKNHCHQKTDNANDEYSKIKCSDKCNAYSQENLSIVQTLGTNLRPYPFIHRHAPKFIQNQKNQTDNLIILPSLSNSALSPYIEKEIVLPSYVKRSDLDKIGNEKVMLKRLESDITKIIGKNKCSDQTIQHINNKVKKTNHLPVFTVNFKMSEVKTWNKVQKLERQAKSINSQSISHQIRKTISLNSTLPKTCQENRVSFSQNNDDNSVTYGVAVNRCKKKIESENRSCSATSKMSIEHMNKTVTMNKIDDDLMTSSYIEKSASRIAKSSAISKLCRNYMNKPKDYTVIQSSDFIFNTINKEIDDKSATSFSKLPKKHKDRPFPMNCNNTDVTVSSDSSANKIRKNTAPKRTRLSDVSQLPEDHMVKTFSLNNDNNIKSTSSLNVNSKKEQIVASCVNKFAIAKLVKQGNNKKYIKKTIDNNNDNVISESIVGRFENEVGSIRARYHISKLSRKAAEKLSSLNQLADNACIMPKLSWNDKKKGLNPLKTVPLKLTIKLPHLVRHPRVKKRKRKNTGGFHAFQPSPCWKSLIRPEDKCYNSRKINETRPKRPNVDYQAYAYTHLLEFDKLVELPCDKTKKSHCDAKSINDLAKHCRRLEIRLERLQPELLATINLQQKDCIPPHHKEMELNHNSKEKIIKLGKERIYQCLNVYPISIDTNNYLQRQNNSPENNFIDDNLDVMWNLSYLSPSSNEPDLLSPPQCWSPYDNTSNESSRDSEKENISEELTESRHSSENLHSMAISLQENKHKSDEALFCTESDCLFLSSTISTTVPMQDNEHTEKSQALSELISDKALPCKNVSNSDLSEFNVEKVDKISQNSKYIQHASLHCRNVSNVRNQSNEGDYNKISLNSVHPPVSIESQESHSTLFHSQDCKVDSSKMLHTECGSDTVNMCKNIQHVEENIQQFKPDTYSNGQDNDKISNDSNCECYAFSEKNNENDPIVHEKLNFKRTKIRKNYSIRDKSNTFPTFDETDLVHKKNTSCNCTEIEVLSASNLNVKHLSGYQNELCENKNLSLSAENSEAGINSLEKAFIKKTSNIKNVSATNNYSLIRGNGDFNPKITSETKFINEKNNGSDQHIEEIVDELCQSISHSDPNPIQHNNTKNIFNKSEEPVCIKVGNYSKCNSNSDKTGQLCSKSALETEYVLSSLLRTNKDFPNTVLSENTYSPQDQYCDEKEVKEDILLITQNTVNESNLTKYLNTELSQFDKLSLSKTNSSNILFNDDNDYKERKKNFYNSNINMEEKQTELSVKNFCSYNNYTNKESDSTTTDMISDTKFVNKLNSPADIENRIEKIEYTNGDLHASDQLNSVKTSSSDKVYETHTSQNKSIELCSTTGNSESPPLSPEEKIIYDSQGNIMSSSTRSSQYSVCLGNHYITQDNEIPFQSCSKVLNSRSSISECTLINNKSLSHQIQETSKCIHEYININRVLPEQQIIQDAITYKPMLNLMETKQQTGYRSTEKPAIVEMSKEICLETTNECFKKENYMQLFSESCLVHNNALETECHTKKAMLLGPFEEVSFVFHSQSNLEVPADETNMLSPDITHVSEVPFDENKLMTHAHQNTLNQAEIINVSCKICCDKDKNTITPVKLYHDKYCKSVTQPFSTKSKIIPHQYNTTDLTVNIVESKTNDQVDEKCSNFSNEFNTYFIDIAHDDASKIFHDSDSNDSKINNDTTIINNEKHGKIDDTCDKNIELNTTEPKESTLMDDQHKDKKILCADKNKSHDTSIFLTKNYIQDSGKPTESLGLDSINHTKLSEDHTSDTTDTYLNETSNISQIDSSDVSLNEVYMSLADKNSGICSFYTANTISNIDNTTVSSGKTIHLSFETSNKVNSGIVEGKVHFPQRKPPTTKEIRDTFIEHNIPQTRYQSAFYSVFSDAPKTISEHGKLFLKISTMKINELLVFAGVFQHIGLEKWQNEATSKNFKRDSQSHSSFSMMNAIKNNLYLKVALAKNNSIILLPVKCPPSRNEVEQLLYDKDTTFKQEINIEKPSYKREFKNNSETETTIDPKEKEYKLTTSMSIKQKHISTTTLDCSCHQHSTPLEKQRTHDRKRKRSSSWSGDRSRVDGLSQSLKCRKISGDHLSSCFHFNSKSKAFFTNLSPVCSLQVIENNKIIQGGKRRMLLENGKLEFDVTRLGTPKKTVPIMRKTLLSTKLKHELLTLMSLEIHVETRRNLRPDPKYDPINAILYCINCDLPEDSNTSKEIIGILIVNDQESVTLQTYLNASQQNSYKTDTSRNLLMRSGITCKNAVFVKDEISLLKTLVDIVRKWNPDILCGYEIQMLSWGYLIQRAAYMNLNLCALLSRVPEEKYSRDNYLLTEKDYYSYGSMPEIHITGRIILNVWRLMRKEVTLNTYTFENVVYHVLHQRIPCYSFHSLTHWFNDQTGIRRWRVINFYITRVKGVLQLLHHLDLINRTSTLARIFGIQFYEVLSRGSQFRVESMMLRSAKPLNYVPVSPNVQKRANAKAPECFPLILEPESMFYTDPVIVLDFQSLYPSMIIAYNYCYSTCLGRVAYLGRDTAFEFGCASLTVPPTLLKRLENDVNISPNGVAYVKHHIRIGVLPQMLQDILNTRVMVKSAMKSYKDDMALYKLLDGRQLALKLIANVTYGYTGASFSGRMPCVEVADSIVAKARETLERAIRLVERTTEWNAKVIYGDTDSMFILLKGRNKEEAFKIGREIAEAVTAENPKPVKLKFEKIYLPCLLQTKKRYVGFMYETPEQLEPVYDAKGIETIRRDSCPAVVKILEMSLKMLFTSKDLSLIKRYVQKQFQKILSGQANVQDFIFAREYRGMSNYRTNACVPALEIARRLISVDPRAEPRVGERIPYVIVYGFPGLPLIQLVHQPQELLDDPLLRINAKYYISRVIIPPLHRVFSLIGENVTSWYIDMPWTNNALSRAAPQERNRGTLSQYLTVLNCPICNEANDQGVCNICKENPQHVILILSNTSRKWERKFHHLSQMCEICTGTKHEKSDCVSLDCPVLFKLHQASKDMSEVSYYRQLQHSLDF